MSASAVVCLGNRLRADDAVGLLVGDRLREAGVPVVECSDEPSRLLGGWGGLDLLVIVDAARSGCDPGSVRRVELAEGGLPPELGLASSHAFGIERTVELARALGGLPRRVVVYAIEAGELATGGAVTPAVAAAVEPVARAVERELRG